MLVIDFILTKQRCRVAKKWFYNSRRLCSHDFVPGRHNFAAGRFGKKELPVFRGVDYRGREADEFEDEDYLGERYPNYAVTGWDQGRCRIRRF